MGVLVLNWAIGIYFIGVVALTLFTMDIWWGKPSYLGYVFTFPIQIFRRNGRKELLKPFK